MTGVYQIGGSDLDGESSRLIAATMFGDVITMARTAALLSNDDLEYLAVNDAASALLGYEARDLLRMTVDQVVAGRTRDELVGASRALARDGHKAGTVRVRGRRGGEVAVNYLSLSGTLSTAPQILTLLWPAALPAT